jgi:hypothetical protein
MVEKWDIGCPETDIIHGGTDYLRKTINLDFVMEVRVCVGGYSKEEIPELQTCLEWSVVT